MKNIIHCPKRQSSRLVTLAADFGADQLKEDTLLREKQKQKYEKFFESTAKIKKIIRG